MIESFASGTSNFLVAKIELKILPHPAQSIVSEIMDGYLHSRSKQPYEYFLHDKIIC